MGAFDLGPGEEPFAAAHEVGDAGLGEGVLERLGLGVGAVEDRDLGRGGPRVEPPPHRLGDRGGLRGVVCVCTQRGGRPGLSLRDELAPLPTRPGEHPVGEVDDLGGAAVVAGEVDDPGRRVRPGEPHEVARGGAGEAVDRLRGVADDAHVVPLPHPQVEQPLLHGVDVLVLVDDEVPVLSADLPGDLLGLDEDAHHEEEDVLEVDHAPGGLGVLVPGEQPRHRVWVETTGLPALSLRDLGVGVLGEHADLRPLDLGREVAHDRLVGRDAQPVCGLGDDRGLVGDDLGRRTTDRPGPEVLQLTQRGGVERAGLDAVDPEAPQTRAHLARRPRRERHREHLRGTVGRGGHPVGDAVRDRPRLARPRAREHAHRPQRRARHLALVGVEGGEDVVGTRRGGGAGREGVVHHHRSWQTPPTARRGPGGRPRGRPVGAVPR